MYCGHHFLISVSQIIMLYTLNLVRSVCQLYLNETGLFQARLQQYVYHELPNVQAAFRKGSRTRYQIANIFCIIKKAREFQKNIYFCFTDYAKPFDCVNHNKLESSERDSDHLTCLLRNLYAG